MDCNLTGSYVHGIFQARILEWVAIFSFRESSDPWIKPTFTVSPTLHLLQVDCFTFKKYIYVFIYFCLLWVFVAVHGLSLVVDSVGYLLAAVHGLLIVVASLVEEHWL